jgi:hypothetical protein
MLGGHGIAVQNYLQLGPTNIVRAAILADFASLTETTLSRTVLAAASVQPRSPPRASPCAPTGAALPLTVQTVASAR